MEAQDFTQTLEELRKCATKRKFSQSIDLIINLKNINLKQPTEHIDFFMEVPNPRGKESKVCALVGAEMIEQAKDACDRAILLEDFDKFDKKAQKKLVSEYDFFIAQANLMTHVAKQFGRVFGPKGKMPNPKAGCVVPPNANLKPLVEKLRRTVRIKVKTELAVKVKIGSEAQENDIVAKNAYAVYSQVLSHLPNEQNNLKNVMMKMTMSKPLRIGEKAEVAQ